MIMDHEINSPGNVKNVVNGFNATDKLYLKNKWNLLVNYQVTTHVRLEFFPVHHNMYPLNFHKNVYT